jgi:predicted transcriptional regulator
MQMTSRELSEALGISYPVAAGLLTLLEDAGLIRAAGKKAHWTGKGKKTKVFDLSTPITLDFVKLVSETSPVPVIQSEAPDEMRESV